MIHTATSTVKFRRLCRLLAVELDCSKEQARVRAIGHLELLWHLTIHSARRGDIGTLDDLEIADEMGWEGDPGRLIEILVETGWLDRSEEHRLVVHDWHEHAPAFVKRNIGKMGGFAVNHSTSQPPASDDAERDHLPHQRMQQAATPNSIQSNPTQPPPPTPLVKGDLRVAAEWLISREVQFPRPAVEAALAAGGTLADIKCLIEHYDSQPGAWGPAALQARIAGWTPGQPPAQGWPKPSAGFRNRKKSLAAAQRQQIEVELQRRQKLVSENRLAQLEAACGPVFDGMSEEQVREFVLARDDSKIAFRQLQQRGRDDPTLRLWMLERLAEKQQTAPKNAMASSPCPAQQ